MLRNLLFTAFLLSVFFSSAQRTSSDPHYDNSESIKKFLPVIDTIYQSYANKFHIPGMVYGILHNGKMIHSGNIGFSNVEKGFKADHTSAFRIASMSKSFTAMAIIKLRDDGKLKLDDPAYLYIPELKNQEMASADAPDITLRNLLTHSAGFPEDNPWGDRQLAVSDSQMLAMFRKGISFSNSPGVAYEYSNMGFAMLGYIIQKVSGKYYADYITEEILHPLGMNNTFFEFTEVPENKLAIGYKWLNGKWVTQPMLPDGAYGAMGGMITTIEDFTKYTLLHLSAWPPSSDKPGQVLKNSSLREMHNPWQFSSLTSQFRYPGGKICPIVSGYGYGLRWSKDCEGRISVGHSGGLPGFGSNWTIMPEYGLAIICFGNLTYAPATRANTQVLDTLIRMAGLKPVPREITPVLQQRKEELMKFLPGWKNAEDSDIFAENFFYDNLIDTLRKESESIFRKAGRIKSVKPLNAQNNLRGSFIIEGEKADIEIYFTLTPEKPALIQEYRIREVRK